MNRNGTSGSPFAAVKPVVAGHVIAGLATNNPSRPPPSVRYRKNPPRYPRGWSSSHTGSTDAIAQYARMAHAQYNDGIAPGARRSSGTCGPSQIATPTSGTNTAVTCHSFGRAWRTTTPMTTASTRYSTELDATPAPSTDSLPSVPGSATSSAFTNALAVASVNATMTSTSASHT